MKKKKNKKNDTFKDDLMNIASKEEELLDSYSDEVAITYEDDNEDDEPILTEIISEDEEDFEEEPKKKRNKKLIFRIINVLFAIIFISMIMIATDVICVARYNRGPFFAIPLHTYNDGGSKAYYGIGYKVIKYHQTQGRRDKEIGTWFLKYNAEPTTLQDIDLAIELNSDGINTYKKYYKKFVRVISTLKKVDEKNNKIILGYTDEDKKYSLEINCSMVKEQKNLDDFKLDEEITIIGTLTNFKGKTDKKVNRIYIDNCFAEQ